MFHDPALPPDGRYAMLLRKSREDVEAERAGRFETLAAHEHELRRLADRLGIRIARVFRDIQSGDRLDRLDETMELVTGVIRGEWDGILVIDLQRITRGDMIDQGFIMNAFLYSGTLIITPRKIFDPRDEWDRESLERDLMYGRQELHRISGRLIDGKARRSQDGQYLGSIAPFGWKKVVIDRMKTIRPDEHHDHLVLMVEDLMLWRRNPDQIARDNNLAGIYTARGGLWDGKTVRNLCSNLLIAGYVSWNTRVTTVVFDENMRRVKKRVPSEHPILVKGLHYGTGKISREMVEAVREQLARHSGSREHSGKPLRNPLAGLLVCKGCGRAMARTISPAGGKKVEYYSHPQSNRHLCQAEGTKMGVVVDAVIEALAETAENLEMSVSDDAGERAAACARRTASLEAALNAKRAASANLIRLAEKGLLTDEEFAERRAAVSRDMEELEDDLGEARRQMRTDRETRDLIVRIREAISSLRDYEGRAKEVNTLLKQIVERVEYEKDLETHELHLEVFLR